MDIQGFRYRHAALLGIIFGSLIWSGIGPYDRATWYLEVAPVLIAVPLLALTWNRFRFTDLVYGLITVHAVILIVGGHYTYALVPAGDWVRDALDLSRNHYDRLGHLAQGFVPALVAREIILRQTPLRGSWLAFLVVCFALAFSAFYEMIEWWVAVYQGSGDIAFLGTQGDVWDTQWDMFLALVGATTAVLTLSRWQDRALQRMGVLPGA
jgi:putative membrane protein